MKKLDKKFRLSWKNYIFQSLLAGLSVFIVFLFLNSKQAVVIAALGATAFVVFAMPTSITAQPRNIIGGYLVGFISGSLCSLIPHTTFLSSSIVYSLAVGLSIFVMVITDTEHPPASGVALGIAISGFSLEVIVTVFICVVVFSLIHYFSKQYLKDLV